MDYLLPNAICFQNYISRIKNRQIGEFGNGKLRIDGSGICTLHLGELGIGKSEFGEMRIGVGPI